MNLPDSGTFKRIARPSRMIRSCSVTALVSALAINLAGCDRQQPAAPVPEATTSAAVGATPFEAPSAEPTPSPSATPTAEIATPGQPSQSRDPVEVLADWAKAVETRDWATARAYWGDKGTRSGLSEKAFAAKWSSLLDPKVTVGKGDQEGAAGSLYYTAPIRIIDGPRTVRGEIVIRRVNDVDGASEEQLRWHIESTTIEP